MRGLLAHANLDRYAGQFVWLELSFDNTLNRAFFEKFGAHSTPTFFVIDSLDERVTAMQPGAMSLPELTQFLDRGASGVSAARQTPADQALARGDALMAKQPGEAVTAYRQALHLAPASWSQRDLAESSLAAALQASGQYRECAETAAANASHMDNGGMFARIVVTGMWCVDQGDPAPWSSEQGQILEPLAKKALQLPTTVRDHRDALYRTLMYLSLARHDEAQAAKWGDLWLKELDAIKPADDEERTAIDIARVENVQVYGDPSRILPSLLASERAMPKSYNASLRVAQMEDAIKHYNEAIAACDRGLARGPGADGRAWLLETKATVLMEKGERKQARAALDDGLRSAQAIPMKSTRDNNIAKIEKMLQQLKAGDGTSQ